MSNSRVSLMSHAANCYSFSVELNLAVVTVNDILQDVKLDSCDT